MVAASRSGSEIRTTRYAPRDDLWLQGAGLQQHGLQRGFHPGLSEHLNSFPLLDPISVGIDWMQRNFEPMRKQVETWRTAELTTVAAKMIIYEAFIESELEVPKHLARTVP